MQSFRQGMGDLVRSFIASRSKLKMTPWERATQLLKQNLSPTQLEQYERFGHFEVIGGCSGSRYRIRHGHQMNVDRLGNNGRRAYLLCLMPQGRLPIGDVMLAQKIALELYENEAIQIANKMLPMELFLDMEMHELRSRW